MSVSTQYLERPDKPKLAYVYSAPSSDHADKPSIMFCGGYRSDMNGTKATYLENWCQEQGLGYVRFDYSAHGQSEGDFKDGTIGSWLQDACDVFESTINGPVIVVGSSMGGWIGLLLTKRYTQWVKAYIGIAAAPDFTERLYHEELNDEQRRMMDDLGYTEIPNDYSDEPYIFTKQFVEDGKTHLLLTTQQEHTFPIVLLHGLDDTVVPKETPLSIQEHYTAKDGASFDLVFIDDGDHSLSKAEDLQILLANLDQILFV